MQSNVQTQPGRYLFITAAIIIIVLGIQNANGFVAPVLLDIMLTILFAPVLRWLERKGLPTPLALLILVLILAFFLIFMIVVLSISLNQLQQRLPAYERLLSTRLASLETLLARVGITTENALNADILNSTTVLKTAINLITGALDNVVGIVFFLFLLFLMLAESGNIARKVKASDKTENIFSILFATYSGQIQQQYRIQALSNLLSAVAITIELLLFRVDFAILWGFLAFVLGFIPNVGLTIATLPAIILAFILHGLGIAIAVIIVTVAINAIMDNIVTPRFMGTGLNLPVLVIFLSFLFWSWVLGFLGALLAVPATLFLRSMLQMRPETRFLQGFFSRESADKGAEPAHTEGKD